MHRIWALITLLALFMAGQAMAATVEIEKGSDVSSEGQATSSGASYLQCSASDPSITFGIEASSYVFGPGKSSIHREGDQSLALNMAGFRLEAAYDGDVQSEVILNSLGSARSLAYVGVSAQGLSTGIVPTGTGGDSYDMLGSADIFTEGYVSGKGSASATASGSANYDVQKLASSAETWGRVDGSSTMKLVSGSSNGMVSTSGERNGLHAESRVTRNIREDISASAYGDLTSFASVANLGSASLKTQGTVISGSWDPTFSGTKVKTDAVGGNENVAISAKGTLGTLDRITSTIKDGDAASVSAILQSAASKQLSSSGAVTLSSSGGAATYAATSQSSSSTETFAQIWVRDASWGSIAGTINNQKALEWGQIHEVGSGAACYNPSSALSFSKILMESSYSSKSGKASASGNMTLATFAQATKDTKSLAGSVISGDGRGDILSSDSKMSNGAGYTGGMDHISYVEADRVSATGAIGYAMTKNYATLIYATTDPKGEPGAFKYFQTDSTKDPIFAWSSSEAFYTQSY